MHQLTKEQIANFIEQGFVRLNEAFSPRIAGECRSILWEKTGYDPTNPASWTQPVVRIGELADTPFVQAANTALLHQAFAQLAGKENWMPRTTMGSFVLRFPSTRKAEDTGWHVDASFPGTEPADYLQWRVNIYSRGRALLMLFLFSDVLESDAPTRIRAGSHLEVAKILAPEGEKGLLFMELAARLDSTSSRSEILATGKAGTVYLCHPFLVHAAQDHRGRVPKFMAQPPLLSKRDFSIDGAEGAFCPVEIAIRNGLKAA